MITFKQDAQPENTQAAANPIPRSWFREPFVLAGAAVAITVLLFRILYVAAGLPVTAENAFGMLITLLGGLVAWQASRDPRASEASRRAWRRLCVAISMITAGILVLIVEVAITGPLTGVSRSEPLFLSYSILLTAGILRFPRARARGRDVSRTWLDALTVVLAGSAAIWHFYFGSPGHSLYLWTTAGAVACAHATVGLLAIFSSAFVLMRHTEVESRRALQLLVASTITLMAANLSYGHELLHHGRFDGGGNAGLLWQISGTLWILAALAQRHGNQGRSAGGAPLFTSLDWSRFLPYSGAAVASGVLLYAVWAGAERTIPFAAASAVLLTVIVAVRQALTAAENQQLLQENELRDARFRSLVQNSSDAVCIVDTSYRIVFLSAASRPVLGWDPSSSIGTDIRAYIHESDLEACSSALRSAIDNPKDPVLLACRVQDADGVFRHVEAVATNLTHDPAVAGIVVNARNVTERVALQAQLAYQATHDALTQLPNRQQFRAHLENMLSTRSSAHSHCAVLLLDLDDFKKVNDTWGHGAGDQLLVEVAARLLNATRGSDMVARLGGDEFAVLLQRVLQPSDVDVVVERIIASLVQPIRVDGAHAVVSASVGVTHVEVGMDADATVRAADLAMYDAKRKGKGGFSVFVPSMEREARTRLELENELRAALEAEALSVAFQPIVDLTTGRVASAEALVRWQHPERGTLPPAQFIPLAEESGLILPLGRFVLREACRNAAQWRTSSDGSRISVTVNVSARQLKDPAFVGDVRVALDGSGLPASSLVLELTEGMLVGGAEMERSALNTLRSMGVRIAVDDFGTGYSSLGLLDRLPIDILKIDRSFVGEQKLAGGESALARMILAVGHALDLDVVAEGVELQDQAERLREMGCSFAQGYLFSMPVGPNEISDVLSASYLVPEAAVASEAASDESDVSELCASLPR